jgi:rhomboid family GlyGly-CTERM serine protease
MGLDQDRKQTRFAVLPPLSLWRLPIVLIVVSGIFELFGDNGRLWLQYDRVAIMDAEIWRLLTGHFVHLGLTHYYLNAIAVILVWVAVGEYFTNRQWLIATAVTITGVNIGLWFFDPQLIWYVGMSGFLHGLLVAGIVKGFQFLPREAVLGGLVVLVKIVYEQTLGPFPGSEQSAGGSVVVDSHLYGALAGLAVAAVFWDSRKADPIKMEN